MGDGEITEANLQEALEKLTAEELVLALQLLQLAKENNCDLRGAISAMKARRKRNERSSAYNQRHKAERNAYSAAYMRSWRNERAEQVKQSADQVAEGSIDRSERPVETAS